MADYFTSDHFKLLDRWKGQARDPSNPDQNRAYEELSQAYAVTEAWATAVQQRLFPQGRVEVRKRPTNQGNNFAAYNWARIYPEADSPKELAYTVGIESIDGFVVKIDTVGLDAGDPRRRQYLDLRGVFEDSSPVVAKLPKSEGLEKSLAELVEWTVSAIRSFKLQYIDVAMKLGLAGTKANEMEIAAATRRAPINRIYYGPPGTGKTYQLQQLLADQYTHEVMTGDTAEWTAQKIATEISSLTWWEALAATLYDIKGPAKVAQIIDHPFIRAIITAKARTKNIHQTVWGTLQEHTLEDSRTVKQKARFDPLIFDKGSDSTWQLAGAWKEQCQPIINVVNEIRRGPGGRDEQIARYTFVTFHQSYGYEEFVEGLRPVLDAEQEAGQVRYEIREGAFKALCRKARAAPDQQFAMVIDEINRGNISKIFGELITLIEVDKRDRMDGSRPPVEVRLAYSGEPFSVPANVDLIGTMNTADRSLALVDTALRRRFDFIARMPDARDIVGAPLHGLKVTAGDDVIDISRMLGRINERVEALYDRDHTIGHAYFTPLSGVPDGPARFAALGEVFRQRVIPLLEEYFFEDWQKIRLVLADNQKPERVQFVVLKDDHEADLLGLFGANHGLDSYATKRRCALNDEAFTAPAAYVGIYEIDA